MTIDQEIVDLEKRLKELKAQQANEKVNLLISKDNEVIVKNGGIWYYLLSGENVPADHMNKYGGFNGRLSIVVNRSTIISCNIKD